MFLFPVLQVFGIPNSPRSLDLDDRQGFIASSAMQQKKKSPSYIDVLTPLLRGGPFPLDTPSPLTPPRPTLHPPFAEQLARESFTRLMRRNAPSSSLIVIDD